MRTAVNHADQSEEEGRHQAVAQHLQNRSRSGRSVHHQNGEEHQPAVRHRRIGIDILEVGLHAGRQSPVDDRDCRQDDEYPTQFVRRLRHQVHRHAETAVTAQLHQHPGMEHRHRRRSRGMAVGTPRMEREQRAQHAEPDEDQRKPDILLRERNAVQLRDFQNIHRRRPGAEIDAQNADQQQRRTAHEHQRQLHGGILLAAAAPDAYQQVHRDQRHLVEHEHREEVHRDKEPENADAQQAEPEEVLLDLRLHPPRSERTRKYDDGRQQQHGDRDAVHAHRIVDIERSVPHMARGKEHGGRLAHFAQAEVAHHQHRRQQQQQRRPRHHHGTDLPRRFRQPKSQHHQQRNGGKQG